ncbi:hypothetical protein GALMADRAFT_222150 [Galerina marginata CBS 339.88]|uniref:Ubiquinone biosynthesis monooxygenase COQ6, mitochondrial n=1 Tax=Galerina marginata (strain CBS 339.88) TaxID=685588 RepID=A0A067TNL7_GALM3|nr:hypothetical protein GALMADRAFT_222150 [Galerina marginata CBS 339.88]
MWSTTSTKVSPVGLLNILKHPAFARPKRSLTSYASSDIVDRDVVIVGGGPAGLALASAFGHSPLLRNKLTVTLIEGGDLDKIKTWKPAPGHFSNRVSSLTNASQSFLQDIGSWDFVEAERTCEVEQLHVWDGISDARIDFSSSDIRSQSPNHSMARLTENFNLQRGLLRHLDEVPKVQVLQRTKVIYIDRDTEGGGGWPLVHLDDQKVLRARLLVGADGFNSPVRAFARIPSFGWPYDKQAIVATLLHSPRGAYEGPNTTAYQRFLPTGPIAFLPLAPTNSSLVWSTTPSLAAALLACHPSVLSIMINAAFRLPVVSLKHLHQKILDAHANGSPISPEQIREEIRWREQAHNIDPRSVYSSVSVESASHGIPPADSEDVPPIVTELQPGSMASFPLRFNHAESYIGEESGTRAVLIGDAAHTIHPLAGQGLNLGLADVECLSRCVEESLITGGDIGSYTALLPYSQERYFANHTLMSAVDKLHKLYSTESQPVVWARSIGIEVMNELDSVKAAMMMTAGANSAKKARAGSAGWTLAGNTVQTLATAAHAVGAIKGAVGDAVGSVLKNLASR